MIRIPVVLAAAALAAELAACATIRGSGVDREDLALPRHLARIPIYWAGTLPGCTVEAKAAVSALSRADLRQRAYDAGADAVIDARMTSRSGNYSIGRTRAMQTSVAYIYSGTAVKLSSKCIQ